MIARSLAALVLGLSAMLAATIGATALTPGWTWLSTWLVPAVGFLVGALCFMAPSGLAAWARGLLFAGAIFSASAVVLIAVPDALMQAGADTVVDAASEAGKTARENSTADTAAERAVEGATVGGILGLVGFMGVGMGVAVLVGLSMALGGLFLILGLILAIASRGTRAKGEINV